MSDHCNYTFSLISQKLLEKEHLEPKNIQGAKYRWRMWTEENVVEWRWMAVKHVMARRSGTRCKGVNLVWILEAGESDEL